MASLDRYTCAELFQRLDDFVDRQLSPEEQRLVEEHLETCVRCAEEYRFEQQVIDQVRKKLQRVTLPDGMLQRISDRLRDAGNPQQ